MKGPNRGGGPKHRNAQAEVLSFVGKQKVGGGWHVWITTRAEREKGDLKSVTALPIGAEKGT